MKRFVNIHLNQVAPTPATLRADPRQDVPATRTEVSLGQLFQHHYYDSFPVGAPTPDPSRFQYLDLISAAQDFRFHAYVSEASIVKRRSISTELGQAFCRFMLDEHFGIVYFAHMNDVLDKATHAAFEGLRIERVQNGDTPDYLCARRVTEPLVAEAKGRFSSINFNNAEFAEWRQQFQRIRARDRTGVHRLKGYVVGTRFATDANRPTTLSATYVEDPETPGEREPHQGAARALGRGVLALHYARVFRKLDFAAVATALQLGFALSGDLRFQVPIWTCLVPPLQGREFVGGFYRTETGVTPELTVKGWKMPLELGRGHLAFVGLERSIATQVVQAARGDWDALDEVETLNPEGPSSSEFSWLRDGTVIAPAVYFLPLGEDFL